MRLKNRDPQKAHLEHLLNIHTQFQLHSSIWRGDKEGTVLFWGRKGGKSPFSPLIIDWGGWFLDMLYNLIFFQLIENEPFFVSLSSQHSHPQLGRITEFWPRKVWNSKRHISDSYSIYITNFNFIALFGGELYEEQTQEMKNPTKKLLLWGWDGLKWGW